MYNTPRRKYVRRWESNKRQLEEAEEGRQVFDRSSESDVGYEIVET